MIEWDHYSCSVICPCPKNVFRVRKSSFCVWHWLLSSFSTSTNTYLITLTFFRIENVLCQKMHKRSENDIFKDHLVIFKFLLFSDNEKEVKQKMFRRDKYQLRKIEWKRKWEWKWERNKVRETERMKERKKEKNWERKKEIERRWKMMERRKVESFTPSSNSFPFLPLSCLRNFFPFSNMGHAFMFKDEWMVLMDPSNKITHNL